MLGLNSASGMPANRAMPRMMCQSSWLAGGWPKRAEGGMVGGSELVDRGMEEGE